MAIQKTRTTAATRARTRAKKDRSNASPKALAQALRADIGRRLPVEDLVESMGRVDVARRRESGELLPLRDHVRGLVLAMLGSGRPWKGIAERLEELRYVFGGYRPSLLEAADPGVLVSGVREIDCENPRLPAQMKALGPNVATLRRIEAEFGHMDAFVTHAPAERIAAMLSGPKSTWKLREVSRPIALAFLENVGIRPAALDGTVRRVCGSARLGVLPVRAPGAEATRHLEEFARSAGVHPVELTEWVRLFGSEEFAAVCTSKPACKDCGVREMCRFPKRR